jgi:hypothetical protein
LDDEDISEFFKDFYIVGIPFCEILVDEFCLIKVTILLKERTENNVEITMLLMESKSLNDESASFEGLSSSNEGLD